MNKYACPVIIKEADLQLYRFSQDNVHYKSIPCTMVLRLMDTEEYGGDYCRALALVMAIFPEIDRAELEKELDKYI